MKLDARFILIVSALTLAACSGGNFSSGTGMPQSAGIPPMNPTPMPPNGQNGLPQSQGAGSPPPPGTYAISEAQTGFACPPTSVEGYSCVLKFNLPSPTPSPKPGSKGTATPTPSPTPTPTPTPSPSPQPSGSEDTPTPSPTPAGPTITLKAEALPKGAPAMVHTPANTLDVVPLVMVSLTSNGDFPVDGNALAQFTLPQEQIAGRGFAVQLFQESSAHHKTSYNALWTFDKSYLSGNTLTFNYTTPKTTIAKGATYVLVLYGDDKSNQSPSPAPTVSPSTSPAPSNAPSVAPSTQASPSG